MTQLNGILTQPEQDRVIGDGPQAAYLMLDGSVYKFGVGKKALEADAFLQDNGSGVYVLNDDPVEEDRPPYYIAGTVVV